MRTADELSCASICGPLRISSKPGHPIRIQVSSGAFPRYARNAGTGAPLGTDTTLRPAYQAIYHDAAHPSAVVLGGTGELSPLVSRGGRAGAAVP